MPLRSSKVILTLLNDGKPRGFRQIVAESSLSNRVVGGALRRLCLNGLVLRTEKPIRRKDKLVLNTLITGVIGSGKTTAAKIIVERLKEKVAILIIDPTGAWKEMIDGKLINDFSEIGELMEKRSKHSRPGKDSRGGKGNGPTQVSRYDVS